MTIQEEILELKKQRNAIILAHNYVRPEIQDIADFCGDSLELSIKAQNISATVILFCGVRFMAETAKLLSPEATVLLPAPDAGCPMASMADPIEVMAFRKENPDAVLVAYVNSTAAVKANVDVCCTSGNVEKILNAIPADKKVMFLPDSNLGGNMNIKLHRSMNLWHGFCPAHNKVTTEMIQDARQKHPNAEILVHPECHPNVIALVDRALSTGGILKYVRESKGTEFVIGTEMGILHRLIKENPGKKFYSIEPEIICPDMKKITLENMRDALRDMKEQIVLPPDLMKAAVAPIRKMLEISAK